MRVIHVSVESFRKRVRPHAQIVLLDIMELVRAKQIKPMDANHVQSGSLVSQARMHAQLVQMASTSQPQHRMCANCALLESKAPA